MPISRAPFHLSRREAEDGDGVVGLAGLQFGGGKGGLVGRIREVLGLHAEGAAAAIDFAALAVDGAVQEIAGVELQAGLIGKTSRTRPDSGS